MCWDVDALPGDLREAVERAVAGAPVTLTRGGAVLGRLEFRPDVVESVVVTGPADTPGREQPAKQEDVRVVATAMQLSDSARARLSEAFGEDYVVLDLHDAPETADVLLTHHVSPQLLGILRQQFPDARIMVTEIEDEELGVRYAGPVTRMLDAGATAYLPPQPLERIAATVDAYLTRGGEPMLESGGATRPALTP